MTKSDRDNLMLAEHVFEVRHEASGTFLDIRGQIADYVRQAKFLPHWKIESNVIHFHDEQNVSKTEGAFIGYKSVGHVVLNPATHNFFPDRASAFWRLVLSNKIYKIPPLTRFGVRTKIFVPSTKTFEQINQVLFEGMFSEKARKLIGGTEKDHQFTIDLTEEGFDVRLLGGPVHKDEAPRYFQFQHDELKKCGLFFDIDYYKAEGLTNDNIPKLLHDAVTRMWKKAEMMASGMGI